MKAKWAIALLVVAAIFVSAWTNVGQSQRGKPISYEYLVVPDYTDWKPDEGLKKLNELGAQGWELTGVRSEGPNYAPKLYLKRVK